MQHVSPPGSLYFTLASSEGREGREEECRQLSKASPLPNPLPVRLAALPAVLAHRRGRALAQRAGRGRSCLRITAQPTTQRCAAHSPPVTFFLERLRIDALQLGIKECWNEVSGTSAGQTF